MGSITQKDIRNARAFLQRRGLTTYDISPKTFASLVDKLGKSFSETLKLIASLKMKGQGGSQFEETIKGLERIEKNRR